MQEGGYEGYGCPAGQLLGSCHELGIGWPLAVTRGRWACVLVAVVATGAAVVEVVVGAGVTTGAAVAAGSGSDALAIVVVVVVGRNGAVAAVVGVVAATGRTGVAFGLTDTGGADVVEGVAAALGAGESTVALSGTAWISGATGAAGNGTVVATVGASAAVTAGRGWLLTTFFFVITNTESGSFGWKTADCWGWLKPNTWAPDSAATATRPVAPTNTAAAAVARAFFLNMRATLEGNELANG